MCGICGFISRSEINIDTLRDMNNTMIHRGPDDCGEEIFFANGMHVGLAQRRLAIIDLSMQAHQPMHSYNNDVSLVFNGEIYNFLELKKELSYPFVSDSDTEVIIAAYLKWGIECVVRFNGMFAFALYDHRDDTLYIARDRIGKKPLYYRLYDGNIVFASELKPIMACPGFPKRINRKVISRYLYQGYINAPDTIFECTSKLEPGHYLKFRNNKADVKVWWDLVEVYHEKRKSQVADYTEAKTMLNSKLLEAVRLRMISDVPLGAFLSGGYDSSLITALMQRISDKPVKTYCIGFNENEILDEAVHAKAIAEYLGTSHNEYYVTEKEMFNQIDSIAEFYDEPYGTSAEITQMLVSQLAKKDVTVVLTGDAGDEFYCGYCWYESASTLQRLDNLGALVNTVGKLPIGGNKVLLEKLPYYVRVVAGNRDNETKTQYGGLNYISAGRSIAGPGIPEYYPMESELQEPNWQRRRMILDMITYLPGNILMKVDRASMKYSLEARCPFLDVDVMEYSFSLRHDFKYSRGIRKRILKDLAHEYIPKHLLDRPKQGMCIPINTWLRGSLRERLISYSRAGYLKHQGIFAPDETKKIVDNYLNVDANIQAGQYWEKFLWSFLIFQIWYEKHINPR